MTGLYTVETRASPRVSGSVVGLALFWCMRPFSFFYIVTPFPFFLVCLFAMSWTFSILRDGEREMATAGIGVLFFELSPY